MDHYRAIDPWCLLENFRLTIVIDYKCLVVIVDLQSFFYNASIGRILSCFDLL